LHWAGKFADAIEPAREAIERIPDDLESHFLLADCLTRVGETDAALAQYLILFSIADYPRAYLPYGELLYSIGDDVGAKPFLLSATAAAKESNQARAYYYLGLVHQELGASDSALEALETADQLYPKDEAIEQALLEVRQSVGSVSP
jgi:tetratricopeptide (TPR) repeat protein